MATSKAVEFSQFRVRQIRKLIAQGIATTRNAAKHVATLEQLLHVAPLNLHSVGKEVTKGLKEVASVEKRLILLIKEVSAATQDLPRDERKRARKAIQRDLAKLETSLTKLEAKVGSLRKSVDRHQDADVISKAGPNVLGLVEVLLRILSKWQKEYRAQKK